MWENEWAVFIRSQCCLRHCEQFSDATSYVSVTEHWAGFDLIFATEPKLTRSRISKQSNACLVDCIVLQLIKDQCCDPYAAFTRSNWSSRLSARQLDERLYGQTVNSTGWNDS